MTNQQKQKKIDPLRDSGWAVAFYWMLIGGLLVAITFGIVLELKT